MAFAATLASALAAYQRQNAIAFSFDPDYPMCPTAVPLPPPELMSRVGSPDAANFLFVCDQWAQVVGRLIQPGTRILDIGAGCGRPARAFLYHPYVVEYVGLDVDVDLVNWSNAYLRPSSSQRFLFAHINVQSDRYAREGATRAEEAVFPVEPGNFNFVIAASLFTHLPAAAASNYLRQARTACRAEARLLASLHIEPTDGKSSGDTHRADYTREFFSELAQGTGWRLSAPLGEIAGQEALLFTST
jgi:SAM-dependent methyltransferase